MVIATGGVCLLLGFALGLFSFKVKTQWCRDCGGKLRCMACLTRDRAA